MGGSEKAGDESKIGQFASGLKYAMALMLRNGVDFQVTTVDSGPQSIFGLKEYTIEDGLTSKSKSMIGISESDNSKSLMHCTGFSTQLGINWEPWMILRELYSNVKDEGGYYTLVAPEIDYGTIMKLNFDESSPFYEIWRNKHLYINEDKPLFEVSSILDAYKNDEKYLKIFKQGVLVYEDREVYSEYAWGIHFGEIDERRILNNVSHVKSVIASQIAKSKNKKFLEEIVRDYDWVNDKDFLEGIYFYDDLSEECKEVIYSYDDPHTYSFLFEKARDAEDSPMKGKLVKGYNFYTFTPSVTIEESKKEVEEKPDQCELKSQITKLYRLEVECEVKQCQLKGSEVIADKFNKTLLVGDDFDPNDEVHFAKFLVQYLDLTVGGNLVNNLSLMLAKNLKR